ncbi:MAG: 30S ribosomal protein S17 [Nitrospinota bacterium]
MVEDQTNSSLKESVKNRKHRVGVVVSNKMNKSAVVAVKRMTTHKMFKKIISRTKKYHIHDESNELGIGDKVKIGETRPLSKLKRWELLEVLERSAR